MSTHGRQVELLYFPECPHWHVADERLREVTSRLGLTIEYQLVTSSEDAERVSFRGSPTHRSRPRSAPTVQATRRS